MDMIHKLDFHPNDVVKGGETIIFSISEHLMDVRPVYKGPVQTYHKMGHSVEHFFMEQILLGLITIEMFAFVGKKYFFAKKYMKNPIMFV